MIAAIAALLVTGITGLLWWQGRRSAELELARANEALHFKEAELRRVRQEASTALEVERRRAPHELELELRELRAVVAPLAEVSRLQRALGELGHGSPPRDLRALLAELARRAGLTGAVLSDGSGLTVAAVGVDGADAIAAAASLLLSFVDCLTTSGEPAPLALVVRDAEGQSALHRLFSVGSERYVLTAIAPGPLGGPEVLDPVLPELRRLLDPERPARVA